MCLDIIKGLHYLSRDICIPAATSLGQSPMSSRTTWTVILGRCRTISAKRHWKQWDLLGLAVEDTTFSGVDDDSQLRTKDLQQRTHTAGRRITGFTRFRDVDTSSEFPPIVCRGESPPAYYYVIKGDSAMSRIAPIPCRSRRVVPSCVARPRATRERPVTA